MKYLYKILLLSFLFILFTLPIETIAQDSTFAFKLNEHKYNQSEDLMMRGIEEMFVIAMDSINIPSLIDTLAATNNLTINGLKVPESVKISYEIDESGTYDFLTNVILDTLYISATGLDCEFDVNIINAGFVIRGISTYEHGELRIEISQPDTIKPEIIVVGTGHILCPGIASIFKSEMETEIDTLLISVASMYNSNSFDGLFALLNPVRALGIADSLVIEEALQSFPMNMDLYTEEDPNQGIVQLVIDIDFLMGTRENPSAFLGIEPSEINGSQLEHGGFSFLYWVLQKSFPWHEDWQESQRTDLALSIMEDNGFTDYRIELRWRDLQKMVYEGEQLSPEDINPEDIDDLIANTDHWNTEAFNSIEGIISNGESRNLRPFMVLGVGHQDRMPNDNMGNQIAPATESWQSEMGYTGISSNEYLYNLKIFAHATVRQFADKISIWQVENELNAAGFASAVPEWWRKGDLWQEREFRNKVWEILVTAIRAEDPTALIIHDFHILGLIDSLEDWISDIDIVGINYYPNQYASLPGMGFSIGEFVWAVRRALDGLGYAEKPVWLTETGYPAIEIEDPDEDIVLADDSQYFSESRQEQYIEEAILSAVEYGANGFFYYSLATQEDFLGDIPSPMRFSGMVRRDLDTFKPALNTYSTLYKDLFVKTTNLVESFEIVPGKAMLHQNYPNPFNPKTIINYELPITNDVELSIYNLLGQKVIMLVSERQQAGSHQVEWDATGFASGVYYYILNTSSGFVQTRKLVLIK